MQKREIKTQTELKPSPTAYLTETIGARLVGTISYREKSKVYKDKFNTLLKIEEQENVVFRIKDKVRGKKVEVEAQPGETVFLQGHTVLEKALSQLNVGARVEIVYIGKSEKHKLGQQPAELYTVNELIA